MHENTPPLVHNLEEDIEDSDNGEITYFDEETETDEYNDDDDMIDDDTDDTDDCDDNDDKDRKETPLADDAVLTFNEHGASVYCCSLHPNLDIAATGGDDERVFIWNTKTGDVIHEISHSNSVLAATFNHNGHYLATGDIAGQIHVHKFQNGLRKVWSSLLTGIRWLKWHSAANVLLSGSDTGEIYIWRIPSGEFKILHGRTVKCQVAELTNDGKKLVAGYGDGAVKLWDIKTCTILVDIPPGPMHHTECVRAISCHPKKSLYMTGADDGKILLINDSGLVEALDPYAGPVEAVTFCPESELAASGTLNGQVAIWDTTKYSIRNIRTVLQHGGIDDEITALKWLPEQTIICGTILGYIIAFDGRSGVRKFDLQGHQRQVFDMSYKKSEEILLTASGDTKAKIFKVTL